MPRERAEVELRQMLRTICHESSYSTGMLVDADLGLYVGWAERKGSFSDGMPLTDESGDLSLVFSGEEFPESGILQRLKNRGHIVEGRPPSYLVHLYEEDADFPAGLNGRFHGLGADRRSNTVSLFNDRYGMHRLHYHESNEAFYFSVEAKAILAVQETPRRIDQQGMGEFIACGCVLENRTLFEGIRVLPPASLWTFQHGALTRKETFFKPAEWEEQEPLEPEAYYQELRDVFSRTLNRYFVGPEPIGMSLTGGLDTRMIMAWRKPPPTTLPCYSFGGMYRDCRDVIVARKVAATCGQTHEVIDVADDFLGRFPHYAERSVYLTDGSVDVSHSPDLYANERAADIAPVRMTGNYGGEVLRAVRAFKPKTPVPGLFAHDLLPDIDATWATYRDATQGHPLSFAAFRQAPWHHHGLLSLEETQLSLRTPYLDNDFVRTVFRSPRSHGATGNVSARLIYDGNPALVRIWGDRGPIAKYGPLGDALRGLIEVSAKAEYAYDYGMPQWLARTDHLLSPLHLERLFLGRHKFYHFRVWYREALAHYVRSMFFDSRSLSRPYIRRDKLEGILHGHLKGQANYTLEIHRVLTLELIHRLFIDPQ